MQMSEKCKTEAERLNTIRHKPFGDKFFSRVARICLIASLILRRRSVNSADVITTDGDDVEEGKLRSAVAYSCLYCSGLKASVDFLRIINTL